MNKKAMSFMVGVAAGAALGFLLLPGSKAEIHGSIRTEPDNEPAGAHERLNRHAGKIK